ncbi:MAG: hypothetical protein ABH850_02180 [Candidatus Micrarchaeota archaeon]
MSEITIFLLALIGILGPANALLWFDEKRNNSLKQSFETTFLGIPKVSNLQNNEIQTIQNQLISLNEYIRKNNGFMVEIKKLKNWQESIYSRTNALEDTVIQIQNKLNEIDDLKSVELLPPKKEKSPKSSRVKILEEYFKKI